jgi:6-phosphofructokinase
MFTDWVGHPTNGRADLARWCAQEELACAVVCVPKSIDNDFLLVG